MVEPGDKAPFHSLPADSGQTMPIVDPKDWTVLYFYPKDDTPGCTTQGVDFTRLLARFERAGARVLGVSKDSVASHCAFRDKHGLKVTLLSDGDEKVCRAFDVIKEKNMYGKRFLGIERSTFLIAPGGRIVRAWRKVKADGHADEVLAALLDASKA